MATYKKATDNRGLSYFLRNTYVASGLSIFTSLAVAKGLDYLGVAKKHQKLCMAVGSATAIGSCFILQTAEYKIKKTDDGYESKNSLTRLASFGGISVGLGTVIAPLLWRYRKTNPGVIPISIGISLATMGSASFCAYKAKSGSLLKYRAPLVSSLTNLVGLGLITVGYGMLFGFDSKVIKILMKIDTFGGILLFTALTAYETHEAIEMYENRNPDHLRCATNFYLNFMNLLVRFIKIIGEIKQKKERNEEEDDE